MPSLLIINPNTSTLVTQQLYAYASACAPTGAQLYAVTAALGAPYIADECTAAIAAYATLEAYAQHTAQHGQPDAVLIACFGDPGLFALQQIATAQVCGLAQVAMTSAARTGPFAIVTGGAAWVPMLQRLAANLKLEQQLLEVLALPQNGPQLAADAAAAQAQLESACLALRARHPQLKTLILGGAALSEIGCALASKETLRDVLIDSVDHGVRYAWQCASARARAGPHGVRPAQNPAHSWPGISAALHALAART
jgi:Asp/Glu/hydantoin racemase